MGTYRTTRIPGTRDGTEARRLLAVNSLGQAAYLTRACPPGHPSRGVLERFVKTPAELREVAGLVEIAENEAGVYVVEVAEPSLPLQVVADRAQALGRPMPPELAAWLAMRVCQVSAALRAPHLRLSLRNVFVRPDGEPYLLGALWARQLPPEAEDAPFVPAQPVEDAKADAFAASALARALAGGAHAFPPPLRAALEAASGGPGWAWMLPAAEAARTLEQALGAEAVRAAPARLASWLRGLELPAPAPFDPAGPTLRLMPVNQLGTREEPAFDGPLPGGPPMSIDGRIEGAFGRSSRSAPQDLFGDVAHTRLGAPQESEQLELDEDALARATAPVKAERDSMVHKVQAELEQVRARRSARRAAAVVGVVLLLAGAGAVAWYVQRHPGALDQLMGEQTTALLRVESTPEGAAVSIGGEKVGETPFVCLNEYVGSAVRVELAGYEPATATVGAGSRTLRLVLKPKPGTRAPGPRPKRVPGSVQRRPARPGAPTPTADDPETARALATGTEEVKRGQAEAARKLGGTVGDDGQFVDPELSREKRK